LQFVAWVAVAACYMLLLLLLVLLLLRRHRKLLVYEWWAFEVICQWFFEMIACVIYVFITEFNQ